MCAEEFLEKSLEDINKVNIQHNYEFDYIYLPNSFTLAIYENTSQLTEYLTPATMASVLMGMRIVLGIK